METLTSTDIKSLFELLKRCMAANREWFIELDSALGDGDLGLTMAGGFAKASEAVGQSSDTSIGKLFSKAGTVIATSAPSTMGTLIASGFIKGAKALQNTEQAGTAEMAAFFDAFVEAVIARGKAQPGEKTVLDSLCPARDTLTACAARGAPLPEALNAAAAAATEGFEKTRDMFGVHGRAAYYQERSLGKCDPGAAVGVVLMRAFADYVNGLERA
jgi:phosphoenolpyruvate---glycerone phosphotransferase subunit DhaL